jgi:hypothetical protein
LVRYISKLIVTLGVFCFVFPAQADELAELERELQLNQIEIPEDERPLPIKDQIELLNAISALKERGCQESYTLPHSDRFVTSFNEQGEPCKTYDLKAPHLPFTKDLPKPQMPVKKFGVRGYINLLRGNDSGTANLMPNYARGYRERDRENFWKPLKKKMGASFQQINWDHLKLSEIATDRQRIPASVLNDLKTVEAFKPAGVDFDFNALQTTDQLLELVSLEWDDNTKTYTMSLDEEVLKVSRQMVLINYNNPLVLMWEQLFRSVISNALQIATLVIPDPIIGNIARIAIIDTFTLLDVWVDQRILRLETVLRLNLSGKVPTSIDPATLERGLNLLYAHREGAMMRWVWDSIKRFSFTWANFERVAGNRRIVAEERMDRFSTNHLKTLQGRLRCQTTEVFDHFSICYRKGQPNAIFNLTTFRSFLLFRLGPVIVYNHQRPWEVWAKRVAAWTLSVASRLFTPFIRKR